MASSIQDILAAKAMVDAENKPSKVGYMLGGGTAGAAAGAYLAPGNLKTRLAGGLVGLILGGGLGAGVREMAVQESPAANMLSKIQAQGGQISALEMKQLEAILKNLYNNPGM